MPWTTPGRLWAARGLEGAWGGAGGAQPWGLGTGSARARGRGAGLGAGAGRGLGAHPTGAARRARPWGGRGGGHWGAPDRCGGQLGAPSGMRPPNSTFGPPRARPEWNTPSDCMFAPTRARPEWNRAPGLHCAPEMALPDHSSRLGVAGAAASRANRSLAGQAA